MEGFFKGNTDAYKDFPEPSLIPNPPSLPTLDPNAPPYEPPRIFGSYAQDGTLLPATFNTTFQPEHFDYGFGSGDLEYIDMGDGDSAESKRRRIARACDTCRKKKIKCDGKQPCAHCQSYKTECAFTFTEKKRAQPKGAKYIESLENRLGRMEHLLRLTGILGEDEGGNTDLGVLEQRLTEKANSIRASVSPVSDHRRGLGRGSHSGSGAGASPLGLDRSPSPRTSNVTSPRGSTAVGEEQESEDKKGVDELAELMDSLITNDQGETRYIGSSSGVSIFSPRGLKWVTEKSGDETFERMFASVAPTTWYHWRPEVFGDIFARRSYQDLPPKEVTMELMGLFFQYFNSIMPLFHEPTFMHLVDMQYSDTPYEGSGWIACLSVALAIAYRMRVMKARNTNEESLGWQHFKNALALLPELMLKNTDLFTVQALIGMCIFLQGTPNPQPSFGLLGAAMRSAHSIGLHKRGQGYGFNSVEIEQRKRVFWLIYLVDKDICLRSGRPPAQDDNDWNVELPSANPEDGLGNVLLDDGETTFNLFRTMCEFSVISSQVFQRLYSVKASKQSDGDLLAAVNDLDAQLEKWKDSIPAQLRPEHDIVTPDPVITIHVAVIHFAYYNCISTIHRRCVIQGIWSNRLVNFAAEGRNTAPINHRIFQSAALSVAAARLSIALLKYIPDGDYSLVWLILYFPISALISVFGHVLNNPKAPRARSDLELMKMVIDFLERVTAEETTGSTRKMYEVCRAFEGLARNAIEKAEREMPTRLKRKHERDQKKFRSVDLGYPSAKPHLQPLSQAQAQPHSQSHHQTQSHQHSHPRPPKQSLSTGTSPRNRDNLQPPQSSFGPILMNANAPQLFGNMPSSSHPFNPMINDQSLLTNGGNGFAGLQMFDDFGIGDPGGLGMAPSFGGDGHNRGNGSSNFGAPRDFGGATAGGGGGSGGGAMANGAMGSGGMGMPDFGDAAGMANMGMGSMGMGMIPPDLFSMPMTFEWDWGDVNLGNL